MTIANERCCEIPRTTEYVIFGDAENDSSELHVTPLGSRCLLFTIPVGSCLPYRWGRDISRLGNQKPFPFSPSLPPRSFLRSCLIFLFCSFFLLAFCLCVMCASFVANWWCVYMHNMYYMCVFVERRDARQQVQGAAAAGPRLWLHLQFDRQEPRKEGGRRGCWEGVRQGLRDPCPIPQGRRARPAGERGLQLRMRRKGKWQRDLKLHVVVS